MFNIRKQYYCTLPTRSCLQEQAVKRSISLDAAKQQPNTDFCDYMHAVATQPYAVQAVVFWSIEQAYCEV